jgi:hypothetical protein
MTGVDLCWSCRKCSVGSVYLFPNLEAALKGVFNRVRHFFPNASEPSLPTEASLPTYSAAHVELNDDAGGALRAAVAKPGLAIEL